MTGECPNCGVDIDAQAQELDQLRAENARLKSEVEAMTKNRDELSVCVQIPRTHELTGPVTLSDGSICACAACNLHMKHRADLQAHKSALEKARVALELFVTTWKLAHPIQRLLVFEECAKDCSDALAAINELLQKGSK